MQIEDMQARAVEVRAQIRAFETSTYGKAWSVEDLVMGLMTDVGDLSSIVQRLEGKRPANDAEPLAALGHEISDCLWVLLSLADHYSVDVASAFTQTMNKIEEWLDR